MIYSILFDKSGEETRKSTWNDFHLIPSSKPDVALPQRAYKYVDVPGRSGALDFTNYLTSEPVYSDRTGQWEFILVYEYNRIKIDRHSFITRRNELLDYFDGSEMQVRLSVDDSGDWTRTDWDLVIPTYYYKGRVYVSGFTPGEQNTSVTLSYRLGPYKYRNSNNKESGI